MTDDDKDREEEEEEEEEERRRRSSSKSWKREWEHERKKMLRLFGIAFLALMFLTGAAFYFFNKGRLPAALVQGQTLTQNGELDQLKRQVAAYQQILDTWQLPDPNPDTFNIDTYFKEVYCYWLQMGLPQIQQLYQAKGFPACLTCEPCKKAPKSRRRVHYPRCTTCRDRIIIRERETVIPTPPPTPSATFHPGPNAPERSNPGPTAPERSQPGPTAPGGNPPPTSSPPPTSKPPSGGTRIIEYGVDP
ncbi:MAG: hypothetical protein A2Y67_01365 [Candidatus Buchananbacteria bacterium RBG_13_39_9]|uniref:Uncharacterized protein n=1 Tax=Candidatus Buchananbacteria bacterium RBG_13_39_9 TaxID=1797531 RepID=A0A1G1XRX2_9BACT|nr:MAG: hypothetical protein A2Y67_01365 [Candidatus Buchananbacteria bacterium RBG_13_39_9]